MFFMGLLSWIYGFYMVVKSWVTIPVPVGSFIQKSVNSCISSFRSYYFERLVHAKFRNYGIVIGGDNPWDIQVDNPNFYFRIALNPPVGLGESYMDGWWSPNDLGAFFNKLLCGKDFINKDPWILRTFPARKFFHHIFRHLNDVNCYEFDVEMYKLFLDSTMNYSCAYWKTATNLEDAQKDKMELIAQKLKLKPGMHVLDIGCSWGSLTKYLAENYAVHVVGCTISKEQAEFASLRCRGYDVEVKLLKYSEIKDKFDRIVSVGRLENVGESEYRTYFEIATNCLKPDGLFLLQCVGLSHNNIRLIDPWVEKYIFPHRELPNHTHITKYMEDLLIIEDWQNFGYHYSKTLDAWLKNLQRPKLEKKYGDRCYRMWVYYLHGAAAAFKNRRLQAWQIVFSKNGVEGGYDAVR